MTGLTYETVARFSQQVGTLYFGAMFLAALFWVLSPKNRKGFDEAAGIPFREMDDADAPQDAASGLKLGPKSGKGEREHHG
jgi:cytochrome c oxidase cbb3-type subunit 4